MAEYIVCSNSSNVKVANLQFKTSAADDSGRRERPREPLSPRRPYPELSPPARQNRYNIIRISPAPFTGRGPVQFWRAGPVGISSLVGGTIYTLARGNRRPRRQF